MTGTAGAYWGEGGVPEPPGAELFLRHPFVHRGCEEGGQGDGNGAQDVGAGDGFFYLFVSL